LKPSNAALSLVLVLLMAGLAIYLLVYPPLGFGENFAYRLSIPLLLATGAIGVLENLRLRAHMSQLVGAIRSIAARAGRETTPEVKAEAVEILLKALRSTTPTARKTAAVQLRNLTGQSFGEDADAWEAWWAANKAGFLGGSE